MLLRLRFDEEVIVAAGTVLIRLLPQCDVLPKHLATFLAAEYHLIGLQDWMVARLLMAFGAVEPTLAALGTQLDLGI